MYVYIYIYKYVYVYIYICIYMLGSVLYKHYVSKTALGSRQAGSARAHPSWPRPPRPESKGANY